MLILKLLLVPAVVAAVSVASRRWGPVVGGWLAGLPLVAGPILLLLTLQHGTAFGAAAALSALAAVAASEAYNLLYARTCRNASRWLSLAAGLSAWLIVSAGLSALPQTLAWSAGAALLAVLASLTFLPRCHAPVVATPLTPRDLLLRMIAGSALTACVTVLAGRVGPAWSGLLSVFPLLGVVLTVSAHRANGPVFVISLLRGMVRGRFSFAAFCACLALSLPQRGIAPAFAEAAVLCLIVHRAVGKRP